MLIVDAFNVLHTPGVLPPTLAAPGVPGLIRLIGGSRYAARELTIVCDGGAGSSCSGVRMDRARVLYSGTNREADDLIEDLIDRYHRGNPLIVVSSDARLQRAARRRRCGRISSEIFLRHLAADALHPASRPGPDALRAQVPLDPYSVDGWLREFGLPPAERPLQTPTPAPTPPGEVLSARARHTKNRSPTARPTTRPSLGEQLRIKLPVDRTPTDAAPPPPDHRKEPTRSPNRDIAQAEQPERPTETLLAVDPLLLQALEEWRDRLTIDDLDMQRWIPDATPIPPDRRRDTHRDGGPAHGPPH